MNILIPHQWLLEHLETKATPKEIQKYLSLSGPSVERIYEREGESVYDIEITTNRVDSMNVRGIAREAAVILNQSGIKAKLRPLKLMDKNSLQLSEVLPTPKIFNDTNLNNRTIFIILKNVKRTPTPKWMSKKLIQTEMNIHDSAIDITNYVTHEIGHPIHAFDYDKLMNTGGEIHIVEAKKGETFTTLDGNTFETVGGEVVFKNGEGQIIDLPSIKGTANTSIDESTTNVLLLAESIRADKVRFASMTHAIRTTAAQLMEKNIDPHLAEDTLMRAVELYQELCSAKIGSKVVDEFYNRPQPKAVEIDLTKIDAYLGVELETQQITQILNELECEVKINGEGRTARLKVTPPTFRADINIPADIVEEIARIYGYHNLPSTLMNTTIPTSYPEKINFAMENKIKRFLSSIGWQEVYTYSLVSETIAPQAGYELDQHLKLLNPLTDDRVYLRRSLLPSLAEIIEGNSQHQDLSVFELANVYHPQPDDLPKEILILSLLSGKDYREVRGVAEALLAQFFITDYEIVENKQAGRSFVQSAEIIVNGDSIGQIGVANNDLIGIELAVEKLITVAHSHPSYQAIPKTMPIIEDLTFKLPAETPVGKLITEIKNTHRLISKTNLKDIYKKNHTFTIEYHDLEKNLSAEEVEPIRKKIVHAVEKGWQAQLVGEV
jgi:phenylalanyl-tRNA synthetase beta chain